MPSFMFCTHFSIWFFQNQIKCIALLRSHIFPNKFWLWGFFSPLNMLNCLQSYTKVTFPSTTLDPQKTLNSSFAFAVEHLYLGWHHECYTWRGLLQMFLWLMLPFSRRGHAKQGFADVSFCSFYRGGWALPLSYGIISYLKVRKLQSCTCHTWWASTWGAEWGKWPNSLCQHYLLYRTQKNFVHVSTFSSLLCEISATWMR